MNRSLLWLFIGWTIISLSGCSDNSNQASSDPPPSTQENPDPAGSNGGTNSEAAGDGTGRVESTTPGELTPQPVLTATPANDAAKVLTIIDAAKEGNVRAIQTALARGESTDYVYDDFKVTPLMHSATLGCIDCMKVLLEAGADINARNSASATALIMASMTGPIRSVKFLLEKGAYHN